MTRAQLTLASRLDAPRRRNLGPIRAPRAGPDRVPEVAPQLGVRLAEPLHRGAKNRSPRGPRGEWRGDKMAIVAVAHSILVIAYHPLRDGESYRELGSDYFDRLNTECLTRYHTKRLAALGYTLTLAKHAA
jgi:hypothetical protein